MPSFYIFESMTPLKVGIVEDDLLIAESIYITLQQIGYIPVRPVRNYTDALAMIATEKPDFLLVDIVLEGEKDGIDLANEINKRFVIPFIFLTANSDATTVTRAKEVKPYAYLVKPFNESDLFSAIEIAFSNHSNQKGNELSENASLPVLNDVVFVKDGDTYHKVKIADILYVESDNIYLSLHTSSKQFLVRKKMDDFISSSGKNIFVRVHRSYAINAQHIESIGITNIRVSGRDVPIQKSYRSALLETIESFK